MMNKKTMFSAIGPVNNKNRRVSTYSCYLNHSSEKMVAKIVDGKFRLMDINNPDVINVSDSLEYCTVSTSEIDQWTCTYDENTGKFTHVNKSTGSSHTSYCINYLSWDGKTSYFVYLPDVQSDYDLDTVHCVEDYEDYQAYEVKEKVNEDLTTPVGKLLEVFREMPKGGNLHIHTSATLSVEGVLDLAKTYDTGRKDANEVTWNVYVGK